jgi:hypothetical protein
VALGGGGVVHLRARFVPEPAAARTAAALAAVQVRQVGCCVGGFNRTARASPDRRGCPSPRQAAFGISGLDHEQLLQSLALPAGASTPLKAELPDDLVERLAVRMVHQRAVPAGTEIRLCPHYRLLLLQAKRPRDFDSDRFCSGPPGRLSALSVFRCKSVLYGAFVWAHRALNSPKRRFPAPPGQSRSGRGGRWRWWWSRCCGWCASSAVRLAMGRSVI